MTTLSPFAQYLEEKFQDWGTKQLKAGKKRVTLTGFATWLGIPQPTVSRWLNGTRTPEGDHVHLLGRRFGLGVYDTLNLPRPDPGLVSLENLYEMLTPKQQREIREQAMRYASENDSDEQQTASATS